MKLIHEIKPSRYHPNHVLSPDPRPRCWIPRVRIHCRSPCRSLCRTPRCQMLSRSSGPTRRWGTQAESPSQSPPSGSARTAGIRCQTVRSPRACAFWSAGRCLNPHPSAASGVAGGCRPRCRPRSGSRRSRSPPRRRPSSAAGPRRSRCRCCGDVWQRQTLVRPGFWPREPWQTRGELEKRRAFNVLTGSLLTQVFVLWYSFGVLFCKCDRVINKERIKKLKRIRHFSSETEHRQWRVTALVIPGTLHQNEAFLNFVCKIMKRKGYIYLSL